MTARDLLGRYRRCLCGLAAGGLVLLLATACGPADNDAAADTITLSDCSPDSLNLYRKGQLTIATDDPAYPPWFVDGDPTNGKGFESAVGYAIAKRLGFDEDQVTWTEVPFNDSYAPGTKKFDFDVNQISITGERAGDVTFTDPYYLASQGVVTRARGKFADATTLEDLRDARLGAQAGSTSLTAVKKIEPAKKPRVFEETSQATTALENGQIDALVADLPSAYYIANTVLDGMTVTGQFQTKSGAAEEFALLLEKGNGLVTCLNAAIADLRDDGTLAKIENRWLSQVPDVPKLE